MLLFRGEQARYPYPATSHVARLANEGRAGPLCPGGRCDYEQLSSALQRAVFALVGLALRGESVAYDASDGEWKIRESGRLLPISGVSRGRSARGASVMDFLVSGHVTTNTLGLIGPEGNRSHLDPLVSFSNFPHMAWNYGGMERGRIIVLSVPRERVVSSRSLCGNTTPARGTYMDVTRCGGDSAVFEEEAEYDAFLLTEADDVYDSLFRP